MNRAKIRFKVKTEKQDKKILLNAGLAQFMVVLNGIVLSVTAFLILTLFVQGISRDEYRRTSESAGAIFTDKIRELENATHLVSGVLLLSDNPYRENMPELIRRNVPGLSAFDQMLWLYEVNPGNWQYRIIFETADPDFANDDYKLIPDEKLITKIVDGKFFSSDALRVVSDLPGMGFVTDKANSKAKHTPFAFIQAVAKGNSSRGVIIGICRPSTLMDDRWFANGGPVGRLTIRDVKHQEPVYALENVNNSAKHAGFSQDYNVFVADSEWKISLDFIKHENVKLLEAIPYIALVFGGMLTIVGALFVRSNQNQSKKLAAVNKTLESKNFELENEVSERERLNFALAKASKDNQAIIDSVSDIIFETDTTGKILFLSAAWRKVTGFDVDHTKHSSLFSLLHPEEQEKQRKDFELLVGGQKGAYRSFTRVRTSDGTFRAVEIAISMLRQDDNKNLRVVGTIIDVEDRRRAERALAEAEKKYRTIVENAAGGLYQITPEGMYLNANPAVARILGYTSVEEMLRVVKNVNASVYPDIHIRNSFIVDLTTKGQIFGHETQVLRKDGSKIWVSENVRVVRDEMQNILYFEGSMEDITQRREAEVALRDAKVQSDMTSRSKTEFITNMSHELRTPLNAIIGFSEIMKDQILGPLGQPAYADYASDIHKSGKGLLKIINEILDIAKIETGKRELKERELSFEKLLHDSLDFYEKKLKEKKIVMVDKTENLPVVFGEDLALKQVVGNIYSNAIKFTPNEGRITIFSGYDQDGALRLTISDTGVGMSQKDIEKALTPFGQVDNTLDRSGSGTGLGLPLAQSILALHQGHLEIVSEKGIGTSVSIVIPAKRVIRKKESVKPEEKV